MKYLLSIVLSCLFFQGWNPEWFKPEQLKSFNETEIFKLVAGSYISEYFITGWSEPYSIKNYSLEISQDGKMSVYHSDEENRKLIYEFVLQIKNNEGILTISSTLEKQDDTEIITISNNIFQGIFYISKTRSEIMFGNDIEADSGPASVWERR